MFQINKPMLINLSFVDVIKILKKCREHNETAYVHAGHWSKNYWLEIHFSNDHVYGKPTIVDTNTLEVSGIFQVIDQMKNRTEQISMDDMLANVFWQVI